MALWRHNVRNLINADDVLIFPLPNNICDFLTAKANGITNDIFEIESQNVVVTITKNKQSSAVFANDFSENTYHNMFDYVTRELEKINTEILIYKLDLITKI